jgi:hypothetical protein
MTRRRDVAVGVHHVTGAPAAVGEGLAVVEVLAVERVEDVGLERRLDVHERRPT